MMRTLLIRGMLVGILAGVLAFAFAKTFGEPNVDQAIAFEDSMHQAEAAAAEATATLAGTGTPASASVPNMSMVGVSASVGQGAPAADKDVELVSRPVQAGIGLFTGVVVYSAAFGGIFALVFGFAYGRIGRFSPRAVAALIAAIGFAAIVVVPQLKYPANPPSVGQPATIGYRSELFFAMLLLSVAAAVAATFARNRLVRLLGAWNATLTAGAIFVVIVAAAMLLLPGINEVPEKFPAVLLWRFRLASLGTEAVLWLTLGLVFGALTQRSFARAR